METEKSNHSRIGVGKHYKVRQVGNAQWEELQKELYLREEPEAEWVLQKKDGPGDCLEVGLTLTKMNESTMTGVCPPLPDDRTGSLLGLVTVFFSQEEREEKPGRNYIR